MCSPIRMYKNYLRTYHSIPCPWSDASQWWGTVLFHHRVHPRHPSQQLHMHSIVNEQRLKFLFYSLPKRSDEPKRKILRCLGRGRQWHRWYSIVYGLNGVDPWAHCHFSGIESTLAFSSLCSVWYVARSWIIVYYGTAYVPASYNVKFVTHGRPVRVRVGLPSSIYP
jgi:hypothetical protein